MNTAGDANENIRDLLSELTEAEADAVRPLLLSLQSMSQESAPPPSPELAALLGANGSAQTVSPARARHRGWVFSLALIGALVAGTGTAFAVSPQFRSGAAHAIDGIVNTLPFAHHPVLYPTPSETPMVVHTPSQPAKGGGTSQPTPAPGVGNQSNGNGESSSGHGNPHSTSHPTPPASPPADGHGAP